MLNVIDYFFTILKFIFLLELEVELVEKTMFVVNWM